MGRHVQVERYKDFLYVSGVFLVLIFLQKLLVISTIGTFERYIFFLYSGSQSRLHLIRYPTTVAYYKMRWKFRELKSSQTNNIRLEDALGAI